MSTDIDNNVEMPQMVYDVVIVTFLRPNKLRNCLKAVSKLYPPPNKVIVVDQTSLPISEAHEKIYPSSLREVYQSIKKYEEIYQEYREIFGERLKIVKIEFDSGLAKSRKAGFMESEADYIFIIDDDIYLPSDAPKIAEILEENNNIGGVALLLRDGERIVCTAGDIETIRGHVRVNVDIRRKTIHRTRSGLRFIIFDYIPNCALFRRACLEDYAWDEFFKIEEHADFYLTHKKLGKWRFAITLDCIAVHDHRKGEKPVYQRLRWRYNLLLESLEHLTKKHGIKSFVVESVFLTRHTRLKDKIYKLILFKILPRRLYWELYIRWLLPHRLRRKLPTIEIS